MLRNNYTFRGDEWPSLKKLQKTVDEWQEEADEALEKDGQYSRRYQNAVYLLRIATRRLEAFQARDEKQKAQDKLTPKEIVDRMMEK